MKTEISILKKRVYALTIDLGVITISNYFLMASANRFISTMFFHFPIKFQLMLVEKMEIMTSISLITFAFAYFSLFYFMTNGRTMGKSMLGIRVQTSDGSEITLNQSMIRSLAYFTCVMTGSFLFALSFIRKDEKSLADVFSGTTVIEEKELKNVGTEFKLILESQLVDGEEKEIIETNKAA